GGSRARHRAPRQPDRRALRRPLVRPFPGRDRGGLSGRACHPRRGQRGLALGARPPGPRQRHPMVPAAPLVRSEPRRAPLALAARPAHSRRPLPRPRGARRHPLPRAGRIDGRSGAGPLPHRRPADGL
ncbi:MAG: hypothetical protein AVDCRST_MAG18-1094, partial [uncultured Thermomicrobiales bacterium]